jgi:hypothetical protein
MTNGPRHTLIYMAEAEMAIGRFGEDGTFRSKLLPQGALAPDGTPAPGADEVLAQAVDDMDAAGTNVALVVPQRLVRCQRLRVEQHVSGIVRQTDALEAFTTVRKAASSKAAVLFCQPGRFVLDGRVCEQDPVGQRGNRFELEFVRLSADIARLGAFERLLSQTGCVLDDVVTPHIALGAAAPSGGRRVAVWVGYSATIVVVLEDERVLAAGTIAAGTRHVASDLSKMLGLAPFDARTTAGRLMAEGSSDPDEAEALEIVDARLGEIAEGMLRIVEGVEVETWYSLNAPARLARLFGRAGMGDIQPIAPDETPSIALLRGAAKALGGEFGVHERAAIGQQTAPTRRQQMMGWLRSHF